MNSILINDQPDMALPPALLAARAKIKQWRDDKADFEAHLNNLSGAGDYKARWHRAIDEWEADADCEFAGFADELYAANHLRMVPDHREDEDDRDDATAWQAVWDRTVRKERKLLKALYDKAWADAVWALAEWVGIDAGRLMDILAGEIPPLYTAAELAKTQAERELLAWAREPAAVEPQQ